VKSCLILPFCLFFNALCAQTDSSLLLTPERLDEKDVVFRDFSQQTTRIISATRNAEDADNMPFSIWVATAEDILRYGFVTLGDVLRAAPGIRVSQPGNALEGETFLMRGMAGNQQVKILINDVPIKPFMALGMPIGAQLPIRQAERIEVLYGPAGTIYGNEACAGVVNIILKESERPVYTQADLSFGRFGYNNIDVTLGGKLGRDKRIFRFNLFGSSTVREDTDVFYNEAPLNTDLYVPDFLQANEYVNIRNYRADNASNIPRTAPVAHNSRLFGMNLAWRGLRFNYYRLVRQDHSALGLNPFAVSYANPSNRISDRVELFTLSFKRQRKRWVTHNTFSFNRYAVDNASTTTFVFDRLAMASYLAQSIGGNPPVALVDSIVQQYNSDERFAFASGADLRVESRVNAYLGRRLSLDIGLQGTLGTGNPFFDHYRTPVEASFFVGAFTRAAPIVLIGQSGLDALGMLQLQWKSKRLSLLAGLSTNFFYYDIPEFVPLPRLAAQYKVHKRWFLRASYSTGLRQISPHYRSNTFDISPQNGDLFSGGSRSISERAERSQAFELGLRNVGDGFRTEQIFFWQEASNLMRPNALRAEADGFWNFGYQNPLGRSLLLWGFQSLLRTENAELAVIGNQRETKVTSRVEFFIQYARGREWLSNGQGDIVLDEVMNQPRWHTQFRAFFTVNRLELMFASNRQTSVLSKSVAHNPLFAMRFREARIPTFRTWDMMLRLPLSRQVLVYFQMQNMFNRRFGGLDATGTPDDLNFNPQPGRMFRLGVNYNLN
jgi:outer membrane receptor protein involved in Fe transport